MDMNPIQEVRLLTVDLDPPLEPVYIPGDATKLPPAQDGELRFLVHCCNDIGLWGAGFVVALSKAWKAPERAYKAWYNGERTTHAATGPCQLGEVQFVYVDPNIVVCNLVGQRAVKGHPDLARGEAPVRYDAIHTGLAKIRLSMEFLEAAGRRCEFHSPKFGSALAGGSWAKIEELIIDVMGRTGISSTVYEYDPRNNGLGAVSSSGGVA